jgi:probable glucitol transport protein GutA
MGTNNEKKEKKNNPGKVGVKRMLLWQSRSISGGANMLVFGFLSIYCSDTLKVPVATVGILLMASKIIDAVTDLFAGYIVDRTNTRLGRARPYELCIIGVWFCTWLLFSCPPEWSMVAKCAWILSMYILVNAVFHTFLNANATPYTVRAFANQEQYVALSTYGSIIVMLCIVGFNVSFPMLMARLAVSAAGWSALLAIYAVPLTLIGLLRFIFIKEEHKVDVNVGEKIKIRDVLTVLKTNPYIYIITLTTLVLNFITNMGVGQYYFTYIVKNIGVMGPLALTQVVILPLVFIFPPVIKKYSVPKLMLAGMVLIMVGFFVNFLAWDNFLLLIIGGLCTGAGSVPISMLMGLLIIDCAEFNEWKGHARLEGTMSCINGFGSKVGSALGAGVLGILLGAAGYTGEAETVPASAIIMMRLLYSLIPMGLYALVIVALLFYKLDKIIPGIRTENEVKRRAAVQVEA